MSWRLLEDEIGRKFAIKTNVRPGKVIIWFVLGSYGVPIPGQASLLELKRCDRHTAKLLPKLLVRTRFEGYLYPAMYVR